MRRHVLMAAVVLVAMACGEVGQTASPPESPSASRLGQPLTSAHERALLEAGWFKAVVTRQGSQGVDIAVASQQDVTGYELVSRKVATGAVFFLEPTTGRVVYQAEGNPGLVYQLVQAGYGFDILAGRGPVPSREELGARVPAPQSVRIHPVIEGGMSEELVSQQLASGWRLLPPGSHTQGVMLFKDASSLSPEGLYLGLADPHEDTRILMRTGPRPLLIDDGGECTCTSPECGNKYKCPCIG